MSQETHFRECGIKTDLADRNILQPSNVMCYIQLPSCIIILLKETRIKPYFVRILF